MREPVHCHFCRGEVEFPAAVCPHCGGPIVEGGAEPVIGRGPSHAQNDDGLEISFDDEAGEGFEILPVGVDDGTLFDRPAPRADPAGKPRPPPLKIGRA